MSLRILFLFLAFAASPLGAAQADQVKGTAIYLQRMALPPNAVFDAHVEDVSRADAPAETIGSVRIIGPGNPPIAFAIDIDPQRVDERHRYSVRATITVEGRLLFTTDRVYLVLTQGNGRDVELLLRQTGGAWPGASGPDFSMLGQLPASFNGDLPCADCPALRYRLNLFADQSFFLSTVYSGRDSPATYDIGSWALSNDRRTLTLHGGQERPPDVPGDRSEPAAQAGPRRTGDRVCTQLLAHANGTVRGNRATPGDAGDVSAPRRCRSVH
jgi:uncharacterized lipoprotein YbaY